MRVIFAGTPEFARVALQALLDAGHETTLVLTQPDRPAGRGMKTAPGAVKTLALSQGLPIYQPGSLKSPESRVPLAEVAADVMVVAAYGLILPQEVLDLPQLGCLNIHASLLPRWRGAAPIQRALLAGDAETGITIMQMEAGLDTGALLLRESLAIAPRETAASLHDRLASQGGRLIVEALAALGGPGLKGEPQDETLACYASKLVREEARIDWSAPAYLIDRQVRAYNPVPGAHARFHEEIWKIWTAELLPDGHGQPGHVIAVEADGIVVACGEGAMRLQEVQQPGGRRIWVRDWLRGHSLAIGEVFG